MPSAISNKSSYKIDNSSNDYSNTDSDTSDDDVMYDYCEGEEPEVDDYAKQKHVKIKNIPTEEALVRDVI